MTPPLEVRGLHHVVHQLIEATTALALASTGEAPGEEYFTSRGHPARLSQGLGAGDGPTLDPNEFWDLCATLHGEVRTSLAEAQLGPAQGHRVQRLIDGISETLPDAALKGSNFTETDIRAVREIRRLLPLVRILGGLKEAPPQRVDLHEDQIPSAQKASWTALLEVADLQPAGWTLVGGQMVALHCWERGEHPARPTNDGDAILDVQTTPDIHERYTRALEKIGFSVTVTNSLTEHEHRWHRESDGAQIDVMVPDGLGQRATARPNSAGGLTLATPGGRDALKHSRYVRVALGQRTALIARPHLVGALIAKARAAQTQLDAPGRHLQDAAVLLGLLSAADGDDLDYVLHIAKHRENLTDLVGRLKNHRMVWRAHQDGAARGLDVLERRLANLPG